MNTRELASVAIVRRANREGKGRQLREEVGVTLREAAGVLLVSPASLSHWERNLATPKGQRAVRYAEWISTLLEIAGE